MEGALKVLEVEVSHLATGLGKVVGDMIDGRAQELAEDFKEPAPWASSLAGES